MIDARQPITQTYTLMGGPCAGQKIDLECWWNGYAYLPQEYVQVPSRVQESVDIGPWDAVPASQKVDLHTYERQHQHHPATPHHYGYQYKLPKGKVYGSLINIFEVQLDKIKRLFDIEPNDFRLNIFNGDSAGCCEIRDWIKTNLDYEPTTILIDNSILLIRFQSREDHLLFHIAFAQYSL